MFDYCWSANAPVAAGGDATLGYRAIVPQTDTLYRYRMSGKASALGSNIRFESGTVRTGDIDPFGSEVVYNGDVNGFIAVPTGAGC